MSDYNSGYDAGRRGSIFGPTSAEGMAGWHAGIAAASQGRSEGSAEWIVAPFVLAPFVAIFYPVATASALAVGFAAEGIANAVGLGASAVRWAFVFVPLLAVFWVVCRLDQGWGLKSRPYYYVRHVVRMLIFALLANGAAHNAAATAADRPAMPALQAMFSTPVYWLPVLLMVVFWQLFFMRALKFRQYWDMKLKSWRLRPKDFPTYYFTWARSAPVYTPQAPIPMPGGWANQERDEK